MPKSGLPRSRFPRNIRFTSCLLLTAAQLAAQATSPSFKQDAANATCTNIVALAGNVTLNCSTLTPAQQKLIQSIPAVLNKILGKQLDPDIVMAKLDEIGRDIKTLQRGVYSGYDFNGAKRVQRPGFNQVTGGEEINVFQQMVALQAGNQWVDLQKLADEQIGKTPEWLTPYLFSGVADVHLGKVPEAVARFKFVVAEAAGDPAYGDATRFLQQLQP